jgi:hypothetical protein
MIMVTSKAAVRLAIVAASALFVALALLLLTNYERQLL